MHTARSLPYGGSPDRDPPCEQNDTQVLRHYLPATSFADGNNEQSPKSYINVTQSLDLLDFFQLNCQEMLVKICATESEATQTIENVLTRLQSVN